MTPGTTSQFQPQSPRERVSQEIPQRVRFGVPSVICGEVSRKGSLKIGFGPQDSKGFLLVSLQNPCKKEEKLPLNPFGVPFSQKHEGKKATIRGAVD